MFYNLNCFSSWIYSGGKSLNIQQSATSSVRRFVLTHVICGIWQLFSCRCCAHFPLMATWLSKNQARRSGCSVGCPPEAAWCGTTKRAWWFVLMEKRAWPKEVWTGSVHRLYGFQSCAVADSAHVLYQVKWIFLREPRWDKWLWRSRVWRKQMQGCSPVKPVGYQSNTCLYWWLVRPQRGDEHTSSTCLI